MSSTVLQKTLQTPLSRLPGHLVVILRIQELTVSQETLTFIAVFTTVSYWLLLKTYTDIYVNTQQLLLNTTLFYTWRHVSAAHTAIFRPAYDRTGPLCAHNMGSHTVYIQGVPGGM